MNIILLGPPGSGKSTHGKFLKEKYHLNFISTGDILRKIITKNNLLSKEITKIMRSGDLVSDSLIEKIVFDAIHNSEKDFILDGFPRNIAQAKALDIHNIHIDYVFLFTLPDNILIDRLFTRRQKRDDDTPLTIKHRLDIFYKTMIPLIKFYKEKKILTEIDTNKNSEEVNKDMLSIII